MTPEGWRRINLGELFREVIDAGHDADLPVLSVTLDRGVVRRDSLDRRMDREVERNAYRRVHPGDIAYNTMRMWQGASGLVSEMGFVSPAYTVLRAGEDEVPEFWAHHFKDARMIRQFRIFSQGFAKDRYRLYFNLFSGIPAVRPPPTEQRKVAAILSSFDETMERTKAIIEQILHWTETVTEELVTHGLAGGKAPLKESDGVKLPEGWDAVKLFDIVSIEAGQADPKDRKYRDVPLIAPNHIASGTGDLLFIETVAEQRAISGKYPFLAGDVLYSKIRPYLRKAVRVDFSGLCSADMYPLRPSPRIDSEFLLAVLLSRRFTDYVSRASMRTGIPKINRNELAGFRVALPPRSEQEEIAAILRSFRLRRQAESRCLVQQRAVKDSLAALLFSGRIRVIPDGVTA